MPARTPHDQNDAVPTVASRREYLRAGMPAIYRDADGFGMRFLQALERVLDPQVAILDCLPAYFSPQLAPAGMVEAMSDWLGLPPAETYGQRVGRDLLGVAEALARSRGTCAGLELALGHCFGDLHMEVDDHGGVMSANTTETPVPYPGFTVRCREPLSASRRAEVERAIEWQRPVQVSYTLIDDVGASTGGS